MGYTFDERFEVRCELRLETATVVARGCRLSHQDLGRLKMTGSVLQSAEEQRGEWRVATQLTIMRKCAYAFVIDSMLT